MRPFRFRSFPLASGLCFLILLMLALGIGQNGAANGFAGLDGSAARVWDHEGGHAAPLHIAKAVKIAPRPFCMKHGGQGIALPSFTARLFAPAERRCAAPFPPEHHLPRLSDFRGMLPLPCAPPMTSSL